MSNSIDVEIVVQNVSVTIEMPQRTIELEVLNRGGPGHNGRPAEFRLEGEFIQRRLEGDGDGARQNIVPLSAITGPIWDPGIDGRQVEIQSNGTAIQWRYVGDPDRTDLVQLIDLQGPQGIQGEPGADGSDGIDGINGTDGIDGTDWTQTILQYDPTASGLEPNIFGDFELLYAYGKTVPGKKTLLIWTNSFSMPVLPPASEEDTEGERYDRKDREAMGKVVVGGDTRPLVYCTGVRCTSRFYNEVNVRFQLTECEINTPDSPQTSLELHGAGWDSNNEEGTSPIFANNSVSYIRMFGNSYINLRDTAEQIKSANDLTIELFDQSRITFNKAFYAYPGIQITIIKQSKDAKINVTNWAPYTVFAAGAQVSNGQYMYTTPTAHTSWPSFYVDNVLSGLWTQLTGIKIIDNFPEPVITVSTNYTYAINGTTINYILPELYTSMSDLKNGTIFSVPVWPALTDIGTANWTFNDSAPIPLYYSMKSGVNPVPADVFTGNIIATMKWNNSAWYLELLDTKPSNAVQTEVVRDTSATPVKDLVFNDFPTMQACLSALPYGVQKKIIFRSDITFPTEYISLDDNLVAEAAVKTDGTMPTFNANSGTVFITWFDRVKGINLSWNGGRVYTSATKWAVFEDCTSNTSGTNMREGLNSQKWKLINSKFYSSNAEGEIINMEGMEIHLFGDSYCNFGKHLTWPIDIHIHGQDSIVERIGYREPYTYYPAAAIAPEQGKLYQCPSDYTSTYKFYADYAIGNWVELQPRVYDHRNKLFYQFDYSKGDRVTRGEISDGNGSKYWARLSDYFGDYSMPWNMKASVVLSVPITQGGTHEPMVIAIGDGDDLPIHYSSYGGNKAVKANEFQAEANLLLAWTNQDGGYLGWELQTTQAKRIYTIPGQWSVEWLSGTDYILNIITGISGFNSEPYDSFIFQAPATLSSNNTNQLQIVSDWYTGEVGESRGVAYADGSPVYPVDIEQHELLFVYYDWASDSFLTTKGRPQKQPTRFSTGLTNVDASLLRFTEYFPAINIPDTGLYEQMIFDRGLDTTYESTYFTDYDAMGNPPVLPGYYQQYFKFFFDKTKTTKLRAIYTTAEPRDSTHNMGPMTRPRELINGREIPIAVVKVRNMYSGDFNFAVGTPWTQAGAEQCEILAIDDYCIVRDSRFMTHNGMVLKDFLDATGLWDVFEPLPSNADNYPDINTYANRQKSFGLPMVFKDTAGSTFPVSQIGADARYVPRNATGYEKVYVHPTAGITISPKFGMIGVSWLVDNGAYITFNGYDGGSPQGGAPIDIPDILFYDAGAGSYASIFNYIARIGGLASVGGGASISLTLTDAVVDINKAYAIPINISSSKVSINNPNGCAITVSGASKVTLNQAAGTSVSITGQANKVYANYATIIITSSSQNTRVEGTNNTVYIENGAINPFVTDGNTIYWDTIPVPLSLEDNNSVRTTYTDDNIQMQDKMVKVSVTSGTRALYANPATLIIGRKYQVMRMDDGGDLNIATYSGAFYYKGVAHTDPFKITKKNKSFTLRTDGTDIRMTPDDPTYVVEVYTDVNYTMTPRDERVICNEQYVSGSITISVPVGTLPDDTEREIYRRDWYGSSGNSIALVPTSGTVQRNGAGTGSFSLTTIRTSVKFLTNGGQTYIMNRF